MNSQQINENTISVVITTMEEDEDDVRTGFSIRNRQNVVTSRFLENTSTPGTCHHQFSATPDDAKFFTHLATGRAKPPEQLHHFEKFSSHYFQAQYDRRHQQRSSSLSSVPGSFAEASLGCNNFTFGSSDDLDRRYNQLSSSGRSSSIEIHEDEDCQPSSLDVTRSKYSTPRKGGVASITNDPF